MWEQTEFEKHWRNEFPESAAPAMNLHSVEDIEAELEKCKAKLKLLQQALSEEKFKVIYLQTTIAQKKKNHDIERYWKKGSKKESENCDGGEAPTFTRVGSHTAKPILAPSRKKPEILQEPPSARVIPDCEKDSDHEFEDVELNQNFVQKHLLMMPKATVRESHRRNLRVRRSRDLDSDDGRFSVSQGSGRSTPDGDMSSEHDDNSLAGECSSLGLTSSSQGRSCFWRKKDCCH
ncbi:hypothetical protein DNTS_011326 [Danionella cerebrum]|uniref:Bcr-Abl oncoprotein oligomerisation domain-containing protein n=1 Tax=Danionella cerebrum TaxID=2873325 RepID=A0A553MRZ1_9TELE|nr:hypothetical protein DNTS_011326 [Danionella translucida]